MAMTCTSEFTSNIRIYLVKDYNAQLPSIHGHSGDTSFHTAFHKEHDLLVNKCSIGAVTFSPDGTHVVTGDDQDLISVHLRLGTTVWALILINLCILAILD